MSKVARSGAARKSASASKRRRTSARTHGRGMHNVPWVPVVAVLGVFAVAGLISYLILQSSDDSSSSSPNAAAQALERDPASELPGEYVNLPEAFAEGGVLAGYHLDTGPDTAIHVQTEVDYSGQATANSATGLPPAGGPHWGSASCDSDPASAPAFCGPAPWGIYRDEWPAETVVHNMEHGGVIVWYNTSDVDVRDGIEAAALEFEDEFIVVMPYSKLPENTIAMTAWARRDVFPTSEFSAERISAFIETFMCRFNPEDFPACGSM